MRYHRRCGLIRDMNSLSHDGFTIGDTNSTSRADMWQVRMQMWQVRTRSFQKKRSIRVGTVGTQNDYKEAAHSLRAREKKYVRTADKAGDLSWHMDKLARLANI